MASRNNALVLVNLGSTAAAEAGAVRQYLNQFLMDRHVIDLPWPIRRAVVSLVLRRRPEESAAAYRSIWWQEGSPLLVISRRLQAQMTDHWKAGPVEVAMRYGEPSMEQVLCNLAGRGIRRITLAPLYPQFANSTVTTVREEARRVVKRRHLRVQLDVLAPFYDKPEYLSALAESIGPYLQQPYDHLLLSYHGLPERHIRKADPTGGHCLCNPECCRQASGAVLDRCYRAQCVSTSERLAATLGIPRKSWSMAFQSRLGRAKWIEPYTDAVLRELPRQGVRKLLVACPAFVADCIETLEEIGIRARRVFVEAGGEELTLIPCLNDQPFWAAALAAICRSASHKSLVTPIGGANH